MAWVMVPEYGMAGAAYKPSALRAHTGSFFLFSNSVMIYTQFPPLMGCIWSGILFGLTRLPIPSSSWVPLAILDCGIFPCSRGTLRPDCHILAYQSTEVKYAEYMDSVSLPAPASLQCGPPVCQRCSPTSHCTIQNEVQWDQSWLVLKNTTHIAGWFLTLFSVGISHDGKLVIQ